MNVIPKASANTQVQPNAQPMSGKERAIAKFNAGLNQAQTSPVSNPSQVSAEELTTVSPPSEQPSGQSSEEKKPQSSEVTEQKASEEPLSKQYAILARKEKALRLKVQEQEQAIKAREAELKAREEALQAKDAEYNTNYLRKDKLSEDPLTALLESGITYDQLTERVLSQNTAQLDPATKLEIQRIKEQLKAQTEAQEKAVKRQQEDQQRQYQTAINQITRDAESLVNSDPGFETIKETRAVKDVVKLIERTFNEDGVMLSIEEAAQAVEEELVKRIVKQAQIKKIQERLKPVAPAPQKSVSQQQQPQSNLKTLTNSVGATRPLTAKERAILAFKGELKS